MAIHFLRARSRDSAVAGFDIGNVGVAAVAFSPDGARVVGATDKGELRVVDVTRRALVPSLGHFDDVRHVGVLPSGAVVTSGWSGEMFVWNVDTQEPVRRLFADRRVDSFALSGDRTHLAVALDMQELVRVESSTLGTVARLAPVGGLSSWWCCGDLGVSRDGSRVVMSGLDAVRLAELAPAPTLAPTLAKFGAVGAVCSGKRGAVAAGADLAGVDPTKGAGGLSVWSSPSAAPWRVRPHDEPVTFCAFANDDRWLVTATTHELAIVDVATRAVRRKATRKADLMFAYAVSDDAKRIAGGTSDGVVHLWDAESGRSLATFGAHEGFVDVLAFSADGTRLVSGSTDDTALVWRLPR